MSAVRVGVFVDWQNCYRTARDAFAFRGSGIDGNVKPLLLARALASKRPDGSEADLDRVRIYTGRASQVKDPVTYAANRRQFGAWASSDPDCVEVVARTLDYKLGKPREKGIDVQLAIDLVRTTLFRHEHDVAVLVSADTDLLPALELIVSERGTDAIEVATWQGPNWSPQALRVSGATIRQVPMDRAFYEKIKDPTDYNVSSGQSSAKYPYGRRPKRHDAS